MTEEELATVLALEGYELKVEEVAYGWIAVANRPIHAQNWGEILYRYGDSREQVVERLGEAWVGNEKSYL